MGEIELKERKPTWDYMLNDLAFSSLKTRVLYGIFDNQERFDFEYQIELKDKEIERLNNIINEGKIYCEDVIQEHENGEYNVSTIQLAIEEHKKNIMSLLNILNGDLKNYWRGDKE